VSVIAGKDITPIALGRGPTPVRRIDATGEARDNSTMTQFVFIESGDDQLATSLDLPRGQAVDRVGSGGYPAVVVAHGLTGQRLGKSYHLVEFGRRLAAAGIACVRFDQAGCGESTGRFVDLTLPRMQRDVSAVQNWVRAQPWAEPQRVGLVGLSLGALPIIASEAQQPAQAVALWAPVYDMPRVFQATAKTGLRGLLDHQGWVPYRGLRIGKGFVDQLDALNPDQRLAQSTSPLLLFHSAADDTVGEEESQAYQARCAELGRPCEWVRFKTADHDFSDYEDRQQVLARTVAFFSEHLLDRAAGDGQPLATRSQPAGPAGEQT
jgi:dipeptidyl aminopeptidase/acylaminoacyl peptidase